MQKKLILSSLVAVVMTTAATTQASLIQWLVATNEPTLITNVSGTVTDWQDSSGSGNNTANAGAIQGQPKWPSGSVAASGKAGVDLGALRNGFRSWTATAQNSWLDFTGAAAGKSGFAVLVAFKVDGSPSSAARNTLIANHGNPAGAKSFVLKYETGYPGLYLNNGSTPTQHINTNSSAALAVRDTVVFAFNYDKTTGFWELWDSKSGGRMTNTTAAGDFSSTQTMWIGTSDNSGQYINGDVFEVRVYDNVLSSNDLATARQEMENLWVAPTTTPLPPFFNLALGLDEAALLQWQDNNVLNVNSNFYIYRSLTSGSGYTRVATNSPASTQYIDQGLANGTTYYYVMSAVGTNGTESAYSFEKAVTPVAFGTNSVLIQHLDATNSSSLIVFGSQVLSWFDQSGNVNDATPTTGPNVGTPLYPSASLSGSGFAGVDLGTNSWIGSLPNVRSGLDLFSQPKQSSFLDFTGAALTNGGFSALVAFKADTVITTNVNDQSRNPVLVNHGNPALGNTFGLRFTGQGWMEAFAGGTVYQKTNNAPVKDGDTIVYGFNYDERSGQIEFWDSKNNSSLIATNIAYGNFASSQIMRLGTSDNNQQQFDGMVGEVKIYKGKLSSAAMIAEGQSLATKWGAVVATTNDFYLVDLVPSSGTLSPAFSSNVLSYAASVDNSVSNLTVTPTAASANSVISVQVNGGGYANVASGSPSGLLDLNEGANTVDVLVTAENQAFTQTYTVTVTRAAGGPAAESITTAVSGGNLILSWIDPSWKLATGTNVTAITNIIPGATSPYTNSLGSDPQRYFRLIYP
jgi:hypothetical protein